jgi:hypothetical protein
MYLLLVPVSLLGEYQLLGRQALLPHTFPIISLAYLLAGMEFEE